MKKRYTLFLLLFVSISSYAVNEGGTGIPESIESTGSNAPQSSVQWFDFVLSWWPFK